MCITQVGHRTVCRDCADVLRPLQPQEPENSVPEEREPVPEEQEPRESVPADTPVTLPAISKPSGIIVAEKQTAIAPAVPPLPPIVNDPGAGGPREKESLLSAALSLILPGMGQAYNGQIAKGAVIAVFYLGSLAAILSLIVLTAVYARNVCWTCLPAFILPAIVLAYAIYDAYDTAERINNGKPVRDWL